MVLVIVIVCLRAQNETRRLPPVPPAANNPAFNQPDYAAMNYDEVDVPPVPGSRAMDEDEYVVGSNQMYEVPTPLYVEPTPVGTNA